MTGEEKTLHGVGIGRGAVYGPVAKVNAAPRVPVEEAPLPDRRGAREATLSAFKDVAETLRLRAQVTADPVADQLEAAAQMAADPALHAEVLGGIDAGEAPAHAVDRVIRGFCEMYESLGGPAVQRVHELQAVRDQIVAKLLGEPEPGVPLLERHSIIVATDLRPAETAALDLDQVLAIVTESGGATSHASIVASQLGIPCVVRVEGAGELEDGQLLAVDAASGTITLNPSARTRAQHDERAAALAALGADRQPGGTRDGHRVELLANVGSVAGALRALNSGAEGVGLLRTEGLYVERSQPPSIEEQATMYSSVLRMFPSSAVVIRTYDAAPERPASAPSADPRNPALGMRGFRAWRVRPGLLEDQLAALALAQERTGIRPAVMAPMITTPQEAGQFTELAASRGLRTTGVMIEVPAAALRAGEILQHCDFVAIGTNDLAQYTVAADRLLGDLADLLDLWEPAVLGLVERVVRAGRAAGKPVGVCGESASDPMMALVLAGMGAGSLSMSPMTLPIVRYALRHHELAGCEEMARRALAAGSAAEARESVAALVERDVRGLLAIG